MKGIGRKIAISIHPFFWIFAAVIGFLMSGSLLGSIFWIGIIFVSVLSHEMGHALAALAFKQNAQIQLVALGGLTSYKGKNLKYWQQFLIVLNGPVFGVLLFLFAAFVLWLNFFTNPLIVRTFYILKVVNIFWSIINLLPIQPLDGGQLLRIALEGFFGVKGFKMSLLIGFILSAVLALACFAYRQYLAGALFFLFAFQSFDMYRRSKNITKSDRDENLAQELKRAEILYSSGKKEEAEKLFYSIREKTKKGLIFVEATHVLALIHFEKKEYKKAYPLLLAIKDNLENEAICLLHKLAFDEKNYSLVTKLSAKCYGLTPTKEVALTNAKAFAMLNEAKPAGGWLKTAANFKGVDINKIISENYFIKVKDSPSFQKFFK